MDKKITVAAAHIAPVYLDARATADKVCDYIRKAADAGVQLVAFPESFIPGFPIWPAISAPIHNHDLFKRFAAQSIRVPGPEILSICATARDCGVMVSIGISEATERSVGCIWNTNLLIGDDGSILNHHRKLVPTFYEKLIWANGDGAGLRVVDTPVGRVGALICGENTNPLARYSLIAQGEQIHVSSYPPVWPTHDPAANDRYDLASAIRIRAGAHSFEAKVFNIVAAARLPAKLLAISILEQTAIIIPSDSPITSVAELKGKKIAYPGKGSQQYPLLVKALADAGLKIGDVDLFKTKGSDVPTLLANKSVDAGIVWDPHVSNALAAGHSKVLIKAEKILPIKAGHYIGNGVYAREDFIAAKPELVQDLITSIVKAIDFILKNEDKAVKMWSEQIKFPEKVISYALKEGISVYNLDVAPEASTIDTYTKFLKDAGILKPEDNPKYDPSFAKKALSMMK